LARPQAALTTPGCRSCPLAGSSVVPPDQPCPGRRGRPPGSTRRRRTSPPTCAPARRDVQARLSRSARLGSRPLRQSRPSSRRALQRRGRRQRGTGHRGDQHQPGVSAEPAGDGPAKLADRPCTGFAQARTATAIPSGMLLIAPGSQARMSARRRPLRSHGAHPAAGSTIRTSEIARAFGLRGTYRGGRLDARAYAWPATSVTPLAAAPPPAHRPAPARGCLSVA
jgi:hypothetical protein